MQKHILITRRSCVAALAGCAAIPLVGCSSDPDSDTNALSKLVANGINPFSPGESVEMKDVAAIPYASLGIRLGASNQALLVLASNQAGEELWTSKARIAVQTHYGRVVKTAGLPQNLTDTQIVGKDPMEYGLQRLPAPADSSRMVDFDDLNIYGGRVTSQFIPKGPEDITILGARIHTVRVVEKCQCDTLSWDFTNMYWADAGNGTIWRTVQHTHPELDPLELEIFRPPSGG